MARFWLDPGGWGEEASLTGAEAHHCARVLRASSGDVVEVFDGAGRSARASIVAVSKAEVRLQLGETCYEPEPAVGVVLVIGMIKGRAMEWLLQKAVELGATQLVPVQASRSVVRREHPNWSRTLIEACKQCGRSRVPTLLPAAPLGACLEAPGPLRLLASLGAGARPLRDCLWPRPAAREIHFLIGPEGDWTAEEEGQVVAAGGQRISLGPAVLRSETAALACLAAARCLLEGGVEGRGS